MLQNTPYILININIDDSHENKKGKLKEKTFTIENWSLRIKEIYLVPI